ncbi:hypothetical protein [Hyphomonas sp.]|uniref:phage fiber-tail adaptor protein n=1 Tax=Hyphomonas sp. TaxID=87 RepID=UPI0025BBB992|nr:hypothetical protein [Hyphomonas sp.]|tara:strand:- start:252 stop:572 length:321 start_codon:yes stop_codon:yes gene_type:complete
MSLKWPSKDPDETVDFSVDWSRYLNNQANIDTVSWFVNDSSGVKTRIETGEIVNNLQLVGVSNTNTVATANLGLGTNNTKYKLHCQILDTSGTVAERAITLPIKEF